MLRKILTFIAVAAFFIVGGDHGVKAEHPVLANVYCTDILSTERLVTGVTTNEATAFQVGYDLVSDLEFGCYGSIGVLVKLNGSVIERWFDDYTGEATCILEGTVEGDQAWALSDGDMCWEATHQEDPSGA